MTSKLATHASLRWKTRFHPLTRLGWATISSPSHASPHRAIVGLGLIAAGFVVQNAGRRTVLYKGTLDAGRDTHIRVTGARTVLVDVPVGEG